MKKRNSKYIQDILNILEQEIYIFKLSCQKYKNEQETKGKEV